ncbi:MAG TPA: type II CAAX endopeptidase family protein, partial [Pyrinomonadaceae bacterium]
VYVLVLTLVSAATRLALVAALGLNASALSETTAGFVLQAVILFASAALVGWACGRLLEDLPWRALGWALHGGWLSNWMKGSLVGSLSLMLAALIVLAGRGFHFTFVTTAALLPAVGKTLLVSALVFVLAAAAEEVLFRGYPLQTMTRARLAWLGLFLTSVPFAAVHLGNPNVVPVFTFLNTALAGVWLGVAYLRTRSLWFPLGLHWAWNWTMGAVLGLPVSGIERLTPAPLFRAIDTGPAWLTGGSYGIEGGAACTLALVLSTLFVWRTRLVGATEGMRRLTDSEIPKTEERVRLYDPLAGDDQSV